MLHLERFVVGYERPNVAVLAPIDVEVQAGQMVCLIGRNGAGKSTLMRSIAGLQRALSGSVRLRGKDVHEMPAHERAREVAVVLTERQAHTGLTVIDAVSLGRHPHTRWRGNELPEDRAAALAALEAMNMTGFSSRPLDALSDGERQRVMLARALAQAPALLLLDEITAFLDLPGRIEIMLMLRRYARDQGAIVLLSSHDLDLALELSDQVWLVDRGKLVVGTADELCDSGSIALAFDTESLSFSRQERRFLHCGKGAGP
jgi:iron complex transport system ATP-binding protein